RSNTRPSATCSSTEATVMVVPRMVGAPPQTAGSATRYLPRIFPTILPMLPPRPVGQTACVRGDSSTRFDAFDEGARPRGHEQEERGNRSDDSPSLACAGV